MDTVSRNMISRRNAIAGGAAAIAVTATGCAVYGEKKAQETPFKVEAPATVSTEAGSPEAAESSGAGSSAATTPADALAAVSQVPVGGGVIIGDKKLVLTQPTKGQFKAFSAVCTHAGCTVATVSDGKILCPCHGSAFNLDGSVANGPAAAPLAAQAVSVSGAFVVPA